MKKKRLHEVDGLRGVAAAIVVIFHYFFLYNNMYQHNFDIPELFKYGQYGVHLFFMISGFVIFWTISNSAKPSDFLWSRFSRLFPVFWAAVILTFVVVTVFGLEGREASLIEFLFNMSMLHEFVGIAHVDGVYWTLTLELAFYFWMYVLMRTAQLENIDKWLIAWVAIAGLLAYRKLGVEIFPFLEKLFLIQYVELFALGICLFKIKAGLQTKFTYGLVLLSFLSVFSKYSNEIAIGFCVGYWLFFLAATNKLGLLAFKPLAYLGTISYALYLTHQNIGYVIMNLLYSYSIPAYLTIIITMFTSLVIAILLTHLVEKPSLRLLRRYRTSRKSKDILIRTNT
jgi:peptidoglycan/LPS O-acetylase OafA/YrhL